MQKCDGADQRPRYLRASVTSPAGCRTKARSVMIHQRSQTASQPTPRRSSAQPARSPRATHAGPVADPSVVSRLLVYVPAGRGPWELRGGIVPASLAGVPDLRRPAMCLGSDCEPEDLDRRSFLAGGATALAGIAVGAPFVLAQG